MMKKIIIVLIALCASFVFFLVGCNNDYSITVDGKEIDFKVEAKTYTVNFETDGGSVVSTRVVSSIESSPITKKSGHEFLGWYSDTNFKTKVKFPLSINKNMTLYAKWKQLTYSVSFVTDGGTAISTQNVSVIDFAPLTSKNGYLFEGWYFDSGLSKRAIFPLTVEKPMTLYAKWLLIEDTSFCRSVKLKFMDDEYSFGASYDINPSGFDFNALGALGYKMNITVTYDVRYTKDYNIPLDIGYVGSPKYEISIYDSNGQGQYQNDLGTSKNPDSRSISTQVSMNKLKNDTFTLKFSTDNVQNVIHFDNIVVKYECIK